MKGLRVYREYPLTQIYLSISEIIDNLALLLRRHAAPNAFLFTSMTHTFRTGDNILKCWDTRNDARKHSCNMASFHKYDAMEFGTVTFQQNVNESLDLRRAPTEAKGPRVGCILGISAMLEEWLVFGQNLAQIVQFGDLARERVTA